MNQPIALGPLPYKRLKQTNPDYDLDYWQELRALYEGGKRLLRDPKLFQRLFPKHAYETDPAYAERCKRAYYVNHLGTIVDFIVAGLAQDPARIVPPGAEPGKEPPELDEFWRTFEHDCSPPGGERKPFHKLIREEAVTALLLGRWWTLVDLPRRDGLPPPASEAEQRERGDLNAYAVEIAPECVLDWEADPKSGELLWAMVLVRSLRRLSPADARDEILDEYTTYTATHWARYEVRHSAPVATAMGPQVVGSKKEPQDDDLITPAAVDRHSFGRVPLLRGVLPIGLWAGNKLHSIAVEYLNRSCGLSWAEIKNLFASLYEFLGSELPGVDQPISQAQADPNRAEKEKERGPGIVQIRGKDDRAEFVGPDTSGFGHSLASQQQLRDDMYRVTYQMKLSADTKGAAIRRSAESKKEDSSSTEVVLCAVGDHMREHGAVTVQTVAIGRGDAQAKELEVAGLERFDAADLADLWEQAVMGEGVSIPSATYQKIRKLRLVRADLGEEATPEVMEAIKKELDQAITQDQFTMAAEATVALHEQTPEPGEGDEDEGEEDGEKPPAKAAAGGAVRGKR